MFSSFIVYCCSPHTSMCISFQVLGWEFYAFYWAWLCVLSTEFEVNAQRALLICATAFKKKMYCTSFRFGRKKKKKINRKKP